MLNLAPETSPVNQQSESQANSQALEAKQKWIDGQITHYYEDKLQVTATAKKYDDTVSSPRFEQLTKSLYKGWDHAKQQLEQLESGEPVFVSFSVEEGTKNITGYRIHPETQRRLDDDSLRASLTPLEYFRETFGKAAVGWKKVIPKLQFEGRSCFPRTGTDCLMYPEKRIFYCGKNGYLIWYGKDIGFTQLFYRTDVIGHINDMMRRDARRDKQPLTQNAERELLIGVQKNNQVEKLKGLAGYPTGVYFDKDSNKKFAVLEGPKIIRGCAEPFPFIAEYLTQLLGEDKEQPEQLLAFICHLAHARKNLVNGVRSPVPVIAMVGPKESGKTLALSIVKRILGGREAHPYEYMCGDSKFNADLMDAELLVIDDEAVSRYENSRRHLAQKIKSLLFGDTVRIEGKGVDAINVSPIQVLAIACNDEEEHLKVLPEMDNSLNDKVSLFHCKKSILLTQLDLKEKTEKIDQELPAFIAYLETFDIPEKLANTRTGAAAWQHPVVNRMISSNGPEVGLLEMLEDYQGVMDGVRLDKTGSGNDEQFNRIFGKALKSSEIQDILTEKYPQRAKQLFRMRDACGTFLGKLASQATISRREQRTALTTGLFLARKSRR